MERGRYAHSATKVVTLGWIPVLAIYLLGRTVVQARQVNKGSSQASTTYMARVQEVERLANVARAHMAKGEYAQAEPVLRQAIALEPRHPLNLDLLGQILEKEGHDEEAVDLYRRVMYDPLNSSEGAYHSTLVNDPKALFRFGQALERVGRRQEADQSYGRLAAQIVNNPLFSSDPQVASARSPQQIRALARVALADGLLREGADREAAVAAREAVSINPRLAVGYLYLGKSLRGSGKPADAREAYTKAAALSRGEVKSEAKKALE